MSMSSTGISLLTILILLSFHPPQPYAAPSTVFRLALQWGVSYCREDGNNCRSTKRPSTFTVHGLWGNNDPKFGPGKAPPCPGNPLKIEGLKGIRNQLEKYWPNLLTLGARPTRIETQGNEAFWTDEWNKHGCYSGMKQLDYFIMALSKYNKVVHTLSDMGCLARRGGCVPNNMISNYQNKHPGIYPRISCKMDFEKHLQIQEIGFLLYRNSADVPGGVAQAPSCPNNGGVLTPFPSVDSIPQEEAWVQDKDDIAPAEHLFNGSTIHLDF